MEKNEDSDLLELQELALKHKTVKSHKSLAEIRMIVKAHLLNHVPTEQLSADFGVSSRTIRRWIRTFADGKVPTKRGRGTSDVKPNPSSMPKKSQRPVESEAEAEKMFNIPIRKKAGAKQ